MERPKKWPGLPGRPIYEGSSDWRGRSMWRVVQRPCGRREFDGELLGPKRRSEAAAIRAWNRAVEKAKGGA